jgi:hypothetical protein
MEESKALIGALIFILLVAGANFIMYAVVRGMVRGGGGKSFLEIFARSLKSPPKSKDSPMDELHRRVGELHPGKKDARSDSE